MLCVLFCSLELYVEDPRELGAKRGNVGTKAEFRGEIGKFRGKIGKIGVKRANLG